MINVEMFLSTGREVAVRADKKEIVAMYDYLLKLCSTSDFVLPINEEDLVEHFRENKKFGPIVDDLSKYKSGELSCVS